MSAYVREESYRAAIICVHKCVYLQLLIVLIELRDQLGAVLRLGQNLRGDFDLRQSLKTNKIKMRRGSFGPKGIQHIKIS